MSVILFKKDKSGADADRQQGDYWDRVLIQLFSNGAVRFQTEFD
ncbi:hypothetical protein ACFBZI_08115 [Moraxella sp. ZJ142]